MVKNNCRAELDVSYKAESRRFALPCVFQFMEGDNVGSIFSFDGRPAPARRQYGSKGIVMLGSAPAGVTP
ncbi:hypothetical protein DFO77_11462 [Marinilabilia salmonicolor]|uniref:Uncharacterized protein n=1 Tax=Marinilabilia salmonicolor TaxID=989 RepID=A0A368UVA8_9BACT|nr:hypothetical protein DFO77_11462 [Marinilabilia salmonicolor]